MSDAAPALPIRAASTIALLRPGSGGLEVLLTHRPPTMDFGPGLHVFPGGAVDPGDRDPRLLERSARAPGACAAAWVGELAPDDAAAHHVAAIRELFEEAGVLLATGRGGQEPDPAEVAAARASGTPFRDLIERLDLVLGTDRLVPLSRWVTPPVGVTRRYDARFFVAALPDGATVALDDREVMAHDWFTPRAALEERAAGRIDLWPPTSTTLQQLARARSLEEVAAFLAPRAATAAPSVEVLGPAVTRVRLTGAGAIPGQGVNAYVVGRRRLLVVDPGDPSDEAAEAFMALAASRDSQIVGILLTSPTPDHAAGSTALTVRLDAPVFASPGAAAVLSGPISPVRDGDRLDIGDVPVVVRSTPGPELDHLAFELPTEAGVLVGDLFGPGASRVIPEPRDAAGMERDELGITRLALPARWPAHG